jgi:hypothetical protein
MADDRLQYYTQAMTIDPETDKPMPKVSSEPGGAYDAHNDMYKVESMQKKWRSGFTGTSLNLNKWEVVQQGAGQTYTVAGGLLTVTSGTTINAETIIRSTEEFTIPMRLMAHMQLSQRIANTEVYLEIVSSTHDTAVANSNSYAGWYFDGTTATSAKYTVKAGDQPPLVAPLSTIPTTAAPGSIFEIESTADEIWYFGRTPDSTNARGNSYVRQLQVPEPNLKYKVQIRIKNLTTAPASSTSLVMQVVSVSDYAELTAEITAGRGSTALGQSIPAYITNTAAISGTVTANFSANAVLGATSATNLVASGTYTATTLDSGATSSYSRYRVIVAHTAGLIPAHLTFEQSTDNINFKETHRIPVPSDGQFRTMEFPINARYVRAKVINGSTAETLFFFHSMYIRVDGNFDLDKTMTFPWSITALAAAGVFTGTTLDLGTNHSIDRHRAMVYASHDGTLYLEQSRDNTNWRISKQVAVTAGGIVQLEDPVVHRYARVRYVNGATLQTGFELYSTLVRG